MASLEDETTTRQDAAAWLAIEAERLAAQGRFGESERLLGRLLTLQEQAVACRELDLAETLGMRGEVRFLANDLSGAEADFRRALTIRERCEGRRHPDTAGSLCSLALLLSRVGRPAEAEPLLSRCLDIRRSLLGADHRETLRTQARLRELWRELAGTEVDVTMTEGEGHETWADLSGAAVVSEWAALRDRFGELSRRLLDAARANQAAGPAEILQELADCRLGFHRLCDEACGWAEAFQVPAPPAPELENLLGIAAFLDRIGAAVINQERAERPRRRAFLVLSQVVRLCHALEGDFAPLARCQERASALYEALSAGAEVGRDDVRPFYDLLILALERATLSDDAWLQAYQSVDAAFGKALAAAAARGHLLAAADAVCTNAETHDAPDQAAVLNPAFAGSQDEYAVPITAIPVGPAHGSQPLVAGPLAMTAREVSIPSREPAGVRFRTADGKLYTLMPGGPPAGPKGADPVATALAEALGDD